MARETLGESLERLARRRGLRTLARLARERLTPAGQAFLAVWLLAAVLGNRNVALVPIARLWAYLTAALIAAALLSRRALPTLGLRRLAAPPVSAGETLLVEVEIENRSRRRARDLRVHELGLPAGLACPAAGAWVGDLAPGETARVTIPLRTHRRGAYVLGGLAASSAWPLGLVRGLCRADGGQGVLVYPAFRTPEHFPVPEGRNYQPGGFLLSSQVGESPEFMHTREYRDGDNPRHIHWPSTARLGRPVVKVYHEEYFVRLALVVDAELRAGARPEAFEWGLSTAAGIADWLSRREYIIDLFAAGQQVWHFQAGRALAHFDHILEILACLDPAPRVDWDALSAAMIPEASRLTGVAAIFMDWSPERERFVSILESHGVTVRVLVVREGPTSLAPPPRPAESFLVIRPGTEAA